MLCPIFLVAQGYLRFNMASFKKVNDHSRQLKSHAEGLVGEWSLPTFQTYVIITEYC